MLTFKHRLLQTVPAQYRHRLVELKNMLWGGFAQTHYSQFGEDIVLAARMRQQKGFYVDVGANHPQRYSNTYLLYKRGWHGINIEPNSEAAAEFRRVRPRDTMVSCGVAQKSERRRLYRFSDPAFNTFDKAMADEYSRKSWLSRLPEIDIDLKPLSEILGKNVPSDIKQIDLLTIDTEGYDLEVLQSNDWSRFAPLYIAIEAQDFTIESSATHPTYLFLTGHGYELTNWVGLTLIFKKK